MTLKKEMASPDPRLSQQLFAGVARRIAAGVSLDDNYMYDGDIIIDNTGNVLQHGKKRDVRLSVGKYLSQWSFECLGNAYYAEGLNAEETKQNISSQECFPLFVGGDPLLR